MKPMAEEIDIKLLFLFNSRESADIWCLLHFMDLNLND